MINIIRSAEPAALPTIRAAALAKFNKLGRPPESKEIFGYDVVGEQLWRDQYHKCCYCERKISLSYNDVEHYRPKAKADRRPGCLTTGGYWWLAFTWENLLLSCATCNRSEKRIKFPLASGGITLLAGEDPPGFEQALLLDPSGKINPMSHIIFRRMKLGNAMTVYARPRNGSVIGNETIVVCGMNRNEMRELREDHYQETVHEKIVALREAIKGNSGSAVEQAHKNACALLQARCSFVALSFDLLTQAIDDADLSPFNLAWPLLENVPTAAVIHS